MRILHIIPSLEKGGAERLCLDICRELKLRTSFEVKIVLLRSQNDFNYLVESPDIGVSTSFFHYHMLKKSAFDCQDYEKILTDFQPDIIHSHLFEAEFFSRSILKKDIAYFSHLHGNMIQFENFSVEFLLSKKKLANYFEKKFLLHQYAFCKNIFIANSFHTFGYFEKRLPRDLKDRLHCLPNAINLSAFPGTERKMNQKKIGLISVGSLVKIKNHSFLLDVVKLLKTDGKKIHLDIFGEGSLQSHLQSKIDSMQLSDEVHLKGNTDEVATFYHQADIYVHASKYESFSLSTLEAMATGLPVVCLDGGGNRELIDDGRNGFILDQPDVKLFAEKIMEIVSGQNKYERFSQNARATAEKYDIKDYVDRLLVLYEEAVKNRNE